jgi:hypothetical protein
LEAAWGLSWASVSSIAVAARVHEVLTETDIHRLNNSVLRYVAGGAHLRASFSLASFGPARIAPALGKRNYPGGFLPEDGTERSPISLEGALSAASDVVYSQLGRIVGGRVAVPRGVLYVSVAWFAANTLTILVQQYLYQIPLVGFLVPPLILLIAMGITVTIHWGRRNRTRVVAAWAGLVGLILVIYQLVNIVNGATAALQTVCRWVSKCH